MPTVVIEKVGKDIYESTLKLLEKLIFSNLARGKRKVLVKPNLTNQLSAKQGITTEPLIVDAIVDVLKKLEVDEIVIGESSGGANTEKVFSATRYYEIAKKHNVKIVNFETAPSVLVPSGKNISKMLISKYAYEADFRISVGKLKIHSTGVITGCLKNMMGCLPTRFWKMIVHADLKNKIPALNKLVKPHFSIIDGIFGNEIDEIVPHPIHMGILIGGEDPVAVDAVAAECMGVKWFEVPYLVNCEKEGLGVANINNINIVGEISEVKKKFDRRKTVYSFVRTNFEKIVGSLMVKIKGI